MHPKTLSSKMMAMTLSEDTLFQGFSCPTEAFHESSLHLVAVQYAPVVLEVFVGSFEAELKPYAGVTDKLEELVASDLQFDIIWSPALTMCLRATSLRNSALARKAAAGILKFLGHGRSTIAPFCGLLESAQIPSTHSREV